MNPVKTVLITGGARRIGASLVRAFHQHGMNVLFQYRQSAEKANDLMQQLNRQRPDSVLAVGLDLAEFENYRRLSDKAASHFGRLDVLINNASAFFPSAVSTASEADWTMLMNVNARAPFFLSQCCQDLLSESRGTIINITDIYACRPLANYPIYSASKAALESLTRSLALAFAPEVRVNAIAPGAILAPAGEPDASMAALIEKTPLKRLGTEQSIVDTALFLANQASFITGQTLPVDGGRSIVSG